MPGGPPADDQSLSLRILRAGDLVDGRFRLAKPLGQGGCGIVWRAQDEKLGEDCALKFLNDQIAHDLGALTDLKREVAFCHKLTHPNIVRVHDLIEDQERGLTAVSMELVTGGNLEHRKRMQPNRWFEPFEIAGWIQQFCQALSYAHDEAKIIHRDLKPSNLLLDGGDRLKVADFGIAQILSDSLTRMTGANIKSGTPAYMSPEQAQGKTAHPSDDLYALGATIYDLLTGKPPCRAPHHGVVIHWLLSPELAPSVAERRREMAGIDAPIPEEWEQILAELLKKDGSQRLQDAREVATRFASVPLPKPSPTPPAPSAPEKETMASIESRGPWEDSPTIPAESKPPEPRESPVTPPKIPAREPEVSLPNFAASTPTLPDRTVPLPAEKPEPKASSAQPWGWAVAGLFAIVALWSLAHSWMTPNHPPLPPGNPATPMPIQQDIVPPTPVPSTPVATPKGTVEATPTVSGEATEHQYDGKVGRFTAHFRLKFLPSQRVSGTYYTDPKPTLILRLEGTVVDDDLFLDEYTRDKLTAHLRLTRKPTFSEVTWEGTMYNTPPDNRTLPVSFTQAR